MPRGHHLRGVFGERHPRSLTTDAEARQMADLWRHGLPTWWIGDQYGLTRDGARKLIRRTEARLAAEQAAATEQAGKRQANDAHAVALVPAEHQDHVSLDAGEQPDVA